jgi:hypothetical protein
VSRDEAAYVAGPGAGVDVNTVGTQTNGTGSSAVTCDLTRTETATRP